MRCEEAQEVLLSDESAPDALQAHLAGCARCAALQTALGSLRAPPVPAALHANVLRALDCQPARPRGVDAVAWLFRAAAACAIVSYGALAVWVTSLRLHDGSTPPAVYRTVESASDARQRAWLRERFGAHILRAEEGELE